MTVNEQRLRQMILGADNHHQPAPAPSWLNRVGTSTTAAMPTSYITAAPSQQGYQSPYMVLPPPPPMGGGQDQHTEFLALAAVDLAKRGARLHGSLRSREMVAGYKRKRDEQSAAALGDAAHTQQQTIVADHLLLNHASKMRKALGKQMQRHMRLMTSAAEDRAAKRLKAKDEEIKHIRCVNWALQEKLRNLHTQAQMWRDVARSKEAAANALRSDLQLVLEAQAVRGHGVGGDVDDASSCCWGDYHVDFCGDDEHEVEKPEAVAGRCKGCGQGEAIEVLLPCRHLCVCTPCAAAARACPACGCAKTGSICINLS